MSKISAEIVADSICNTHRIITMKVVFPRIILSEKNTHRMLSKNSASSRAIPFKKMIRIVMTDPFIPIAWQRDHTGMQGKEYIDPTEKFSLNDYLPIMRQVLNDLTGNDPDHDTEDSFQMYRSLLTKYDGQSKTLEGWWLTARDLVVEVALLLSVFGLTKQLCNRLLEPFMWHTVLVTATEYENFFHLRCPQYQHQDGKVFRSWKDLVKDAFNSGGSRDWVDGLENMSTLERLQHNKGQAEIHMMALAEAMWDARNESKPKELQPGQWHIPYDEKIEWTKFDPSGYVFTADEAFQHWKVKLSTAMCAQTSYIIIGEDGKPTSYENLLDLHNSLLVRPYTNRKGVVFGEDDPIHTSPSEHCAQAMTEKEYNWTVKRGVNDVYIEERGWCHNLRGWKSYRSMIPNENRR